MLQLDLLMDPYTMRVELKYTTMVNGALYATMDGTILMFVWYASSWDLDQPEGHTVELVLVKDQDQYGLIMWHVAAMNQQ